jgi:hypothetical protein
MMSTGSPMTWHIGEPEISIGDVKIEATVRILEHSRAM